MEYYRRIIPFFTEDGGVVKNHHEVEESLSQQQHPKARKGVLYNPVRHRAKRKRKFSINITGNLLIITTILLPLIISPDSVESVSFSSSSSQRRPPLPTRATMTSPPSSAVIMFSVLTAISALLLVDSSSSTTSSRASSAGRGRVVSEIHHSGPRVGNNDDESKEIIEVVRYGEEHIDLDDGDDMRKGLLVDEYIEQENDNVRDENDDEEVIVVTSVDGTMAGLSRSTGRTLWKNEGVCVSGKEGEGSGEEKVGDESLTSPTREKIRLKGKKDCADGSEGYGRRLFAPLLSTTTTKKSSSSSGHDWRTAAVPSLDGRVYLTPGKHGLGPSKPLTTPPATHTTTSPGLTTTTATIRDLVSRAPFADTRGRFYVGSRRSTVTALDRDSGEVLRVALGDGEEGEDQEEKISLEGRNVVWVGRIDYSVAVYEARNGEMDVEFSASEVLSVDDMVRGRSSPAEGVLGFGRSDVPLLPAGREGKYKVEDTAGATMEKEEQTNKEFQTSSSSSSTPFSSLLVATPNGHIALRDPETGLIAWVAPETFSSPVAFAVDSSSGESIGVDIIPDAVIPHKSSAEYLQKEFQRQIAATYDSASTNSKEETIVGALESGQLFALNLGRRGGFQNREFYKKHGILSLPKPPQTAASSPASVDATGNRARAISGIHDNDLQDNNHKANTNGEDHPKSILGLGKKRHHCEPFPGCLFGKRTVPHHDGDILSNVFGGDPFLNALPNDHVNLDLIHLQRKQKTKEGKSRWFRDFLSVMSSWVAPAVALAFVVSFEMGRRERIRVETALVAGGENTRGRIMDPPSSSSSSLPDVIDPTPDKTRANGLVVTQTQAPAVIQVTEEVLGYGGHGTVVYRGKLDERNVAVKRMLKAYHASADREISLLIESDGHPNVVRYYLKEIRGDFVYLALELCDMSLQDLILAMTKHTNAIIAGHTPQQTDHPTTETDVEEVSPATKSVLLQVASGVRHIHSLRIVHRDLKPQNILLARKVKRNKVPCKDDNETALICDAFQKREYIPKISDMGLGKQLVGQSSFGMSTYGTNTSANHPSSLPSRADASSIVGAGPGSVGWQAPEVMAQRFSPESSSKPCTGLPMSSASEPHSMVEASPIDATSSNRVSRSVDIFSLGCIFYCTILPGSHPFGEWYEREANIMKNRPQTTPLERLSEDAFDLVNSMIHRDAKLRPTAKEVCFHPFFWKREKRLAFLCELSDRLEVESSGQKDHLDPFIIEKNASDVVGTTWDRLLDPGLINDASKFRTYDPSSVRDFLRMVRNKHHHYDELPSEVKERVGSNPEGLVRYFEKRFPKLLMHCYHVCREALPPDDGLLVKYEIGSRRKMQPGFDEVPKQALNENLNENGGIIPEHEKVLEKDVGAGNDRKAMTENQSTQEDSKVPPQSPTVGCSTTGDSTTPMHKSCSPTPPPPTNPEGLIVWSGSTASKTFNTRGWARSDSEWINPPTPLLRKTNPTLTRLSTDPKFRTRLCNHWDASRGTHCPMRKKNKCVFAHGPVELRVKEGKRGRWGKLVDKNGDNKNPCHSGGEDTFGAARSVELVRKEEGKWNTSGGGGRFRGKNGRKR